MEKKCDEIVCNRPGCNKKGQTLEEFLACYDADRYKKPSVTVDMLIFCDDNAQSTLQLLLIERANHPCINTWALPGGFVEMDENLEQAAMRELEEETHLKEAYLEQLYTYGDVDRDPRGRTISVAYLAIISNKDEDMHADDDAKNAAWFDVSCNKVKEETFEETSTKGMKAKNVKTVTEYEIKLQAKEISLSAKVQRICTQIGRRKKEEMILLENNQIAFDHAKIILKGYLKANEED